jgi:ubiquinone/menaquinone biosynthesis C-methylase UbiE
MTQACASTDKIWPRKVIGESNPQCQYETLLDPIKDIFVGNSVLDVGCYTGYSTDLIKKYHAVRCTGLDLVEEFIDTAKESFEQQDVQFLCGSLSDLELVKQLVKEHNVVTSFGNFYHMYNHFDLIKLFCQPHVKYLVLDSIYGPESADPGMFWTFQQIIRQKKEIIAKGTPNISWIMQACKCFGFKLDYVHRYYSRTDWNNIEDFNANMRMTMRFFNSNIIDKTTYFEIDDVWPWSNEFLIQKV